jgi:endonuclease YncB( thermonuclease family)
MIEFWQKDFINKLIVLTSLLILVSIGVVIYLITSTTPGKDLVSRLYPTPTLSVQQLFEISGATATAKSVNATASVVPTITTQPFTVVVKSPTPGSTAVESASVQSQLASPTPTLTPSPTPTTGPAVSSNVSAASCLPNAPVQTGTVINVVNSSTVQVLLDDLVYSVRYIGLVPPSDADIAQASTFANGDLVFGKKVTLIADGANMDAGGSLLRYVLAGDTLANLEMLKQGFAQLDEDAPTFACLALFQSAQDEAQAIKVGMWK